MFSCFDPKPKAFLKIIAAKIPKDVFRGEIYLMGAVRKNPRPRGGPPPLPLGKCSPDNFGGLHLKSSTDKFSRHLSSPLNISLG